MYENKGVDRPFVELICSDRVKKSTSGRIDQIKLLKDGRLRALAIEGADRASLLDLGTKDSALKELPLLVRRDSELTASQSLYAIDPGGYISALYESSNFLGNAYMRLFDPNGKQRFEKVLQKAAINDVIPMMNFFSPNGIGARTYGSVGHSETRFDFNGAVIKRDQQEGEIEWYDNRYIDDPQNGYYLQGLHWFVFCEMGTGESPGGTYPYLRRVDNDSDISLYPFSQPLTYLAPHLDARPGTRFPWEDPSYPVGDYGFERACFNHTIFATEVDSDSNVYVLFGLRSASYLEGNWPVAEIFLLQKISPSGQLLWEKTLNGTEVWSDYFFLEYDYPGLIPQSINWVRGRDLLMLIGKIPAAADSSENKRDEYRAIFINTLGQVLHVQKLGYVLPFTDQSTPRRSNLVSNTDSSVLFQIRDRESFSKNGNEYRLNMLKTHLPRLDGVQRYRIEQCGWQGGGTVIGEFVGEDRNRDGFIDLNQGEVLSYSVTFSGNNLVPKFTHSLNDLKYFRYTIGSSGFRPSYPLSSDNGVTLYDADDYSIMYKDELIGATTSAVVTKLSLVK